MKTMPAWQQEYLINKRYRPLDELLEMPRVRILRALTHWDWISGEDLNVALEVTFDPKVTNNYTLTLSRLVRDGLVERRAIFTKRGVRARRQRRVLRGGLSPAYTRYRITARGRRELDALLARAVVGEAVQA